MFENQEQQVKNIAGAPPLLRGANFIIDTTIVLIILFLLYQLVDSNWKNLSIQLQNTDNPSLTLQLIYAFTNLMYFTLTEALMNGQTIGKLLTNTQAIRVDGEAFTIREAFLRSLCRQLQVEVIFAAIGFIIHDKWTSTVVVEKS